MSRHDKNKRQVKVALPEMDNFIGTIGYPTLEMAEAAIVRFAEQGIKAVIVASDQGGKDVE